MIDSNQNITRKFDLNRKKIKLKIDFDSSLTCYSLDPKSISNYLFISTSMAYFSLFGVYQNRNAGKYKKKLWNENAFGFIKIVSIALFNVCDVFWKVL